MLTFEDKIDVINKEIAKRRHKWMLKSLSDMDFDDVSQILRLHIYNKWHLWKQELPLKNWVNRVITRRMCNLVRDKWGNVAPPCRDCKFDEGENRCGHTPSGEKCNECPLYKKWSHKKRTAYHIKLADSIDDPNYIEGKNRHIGALGDPNSSTSHVDYEKSEQRLHDKMKEQLNDLQWSIYRLMFIYNRSNEEIAELVGYKTSENNRSPGYKQLCNMRKVFAEKAKKIMSKEDIICG